MSESEDAVENLRVIRRLMERATVYRTISAPAALVGGALALATALPGVFGGSDPKGLLFVVVWMVVLAASTVCNLFLLAREASGRDEPFYSRSMRTAFLTVAPPLIAGGAIGIAFALIGGNVAACVVTWILFYGLALLATSSFAPRSLVLLGAAFTAAGIVLAATGIIAGVQGLWGGTSMGSFLMALTFGLFHLTYGAAVLLSKRRQPANADTGDAAPADG